MINKIKPYLGTKFDIKNMGEAFYVLGIKITRYRKSKMLYLDQENYVEKIFKQFNMKKCKSVSTPTCKSTILSKNLCPQNKVKLEEMQKVWESNVCND